MSSRLFQSDVPQKNQFIKCSDVVVRGTLRCEGDASFLGTSLTSTGGITAKSLALTVGGDGKITLPTLVRYQQLTSETTPVTITGGEQQFLVATATAGTVAAGTTRLFTITHAGVFAGSTMVLINRAGTFAGNQQVISYVAFTGASTIRIGMHNLSTVAATGSDELMFKLIQT